MDLYSRLNSSEPSRDRRELDTRVKHRLSTAAAAATRSSSFLDPRFRALYTEELGLEVPDDFATFLSIQKFFKEGPAREILDGITLLVHVLNEAMWSKKARDWVDRCNRIFAEHQVAYRVADNGLVHAFVDDAFQDAARAAISVLSNAKYRAAAVALERAIDEVNKRDGHPNTAIREAYAAVETAFKVATRHGGTLGATDIERVLGPCVDQSYAAEDTIAKGAASQVVQSMKDWVNAAHKYRHGHGLPDPIEAPPKLAVALVSMAVTFARFIGDHFP